MRRLRPVLLAKQAGLVVVGVPGVSPLSYEEVRERCQDCTARLGVLRSRQNVRHDLVSGVYAAHPTDRSESDVG